MNLNKHESFRLLSDRLLEFYWDSFCFFVFLFRLSVLSKCEMEEVPVTDILIPKSVKQVIDTR